MNKNLFCILFNQAKGSWVVVREAAISRGAVRYCGCIPMLVRCAGTVLGRCGTVALILDLILSPLLQAQVAVHPEAAPANRPLVETTANQTPLIQIAPPNSAGLSDNHYSHFNVDGRGIILNNAADAVQTRLGGTVAGNPFLTSGSAGVILNQVLGTQPSLLSGFTEVAGQRADVIIANPNGIVCNGGGFINTSRGVLTTGVPVLGANGGLEAFRVQGGLLRVGPQGLRGAGLDQVDLLARGLEVNGVIQTQGALNVITGRNQVSYADLGVQVIRDASGQSMVGIDVGLLGSMYANRILLIGTEAGVGVNSQGSITAQGGSFTCTQEGRVLLTGTTAAKGDLTLTARQGILNQGTVFAGGKATLKSEGALLNDHGAIAVHQLSVDAGALSNREGTIVQAGPGATRMVIAGGLDNTAGAIVTSGVDAQIQAASLDNAEKGEISHSGTGRLELAAGDLNNEAGLIHTKGALALTATKDLRNAGGTLHAERFLSAQGHTIDNDAGQIAALSGGLSINAGERLTNAPGTTALGADGGLISSTGRAVLNASHLETRGTILGGQGLRVQAHRLDNRGALTSAGRLEASATTLTNAEGHITAPSVTLTVADLDNSRGEVLADSLTIQTTHLTNHGGDLTHLGEGPMILKVKDALVNTGEGRIRTNSRDLQLTPRTFDNSGGTIAHGGTGSLSLEVGQGQGDLLNPLGTIASNGAVTLAGARIDNRGGVLAAQKQLEGTALQGDLDNGDATGTTGFIGGDQVRLAANQGALLNQGGTIEGTRGLTLHARRLDNTDGKMTNLGQAPLAVTTREDILNQAGLISSRGETRIQTGALVNTGTLGAGHDLKLRARITENHGTLMAGGGLDLDAATLDNGKGLVSAPRVTLKVRDLDNREGEVVAERLTVSAQTLENAAGRLTHLGVEPMTLKVAQTLNNGGGLIQTRATHPKIETPRLVNEGGTIGHLGDGILSLGTAEGQGALINTSGRIASLGQLEVTTGTVANQGGSLVAQHRVKVTATIGSIDNATIQDQPGSIGAARVDLVAIHGALGNQGGIIEGKDGVAIQVVTLNNNGGNLTNTGQEGVLDVTVAEKLDNAGGTLGSNGETTVAAESMHNAQGTVQGGEKMTLEVSGTLDNQGGTTHANQNLVLNAAGVVNAGGQISATGSLQVTAPDFANAGGRLGAGEDLQLTTGTMPAGGQIQGQRDAAYQFQGDYTLPAGQPLSAGRNLTLATTGTLTALGSLSAPGEVKVQAADLHLEADSLIHGGTIQATASHELVSKGRLLGQDVGLEGGAGVQHSGTLVAQGGATVTSQGPIHNPGTLATRQDLVLTGAEVHSQGRLGAGIDDQGQAVLPGHLKVIATGPVTASGDNTAGGSVTIQGRDLALAGARTSAGGNITLTGHDLHHEGGTLQARGEFSATLTGDFVNDGGTMAAQKVRATAARVSNQGGSIAHTGATESLVESRGALDNRAGRILNAAGPAKVLAEGDLGNGQGMIQAQRDLTLKGQGITNAGGQILSTQGGLDLTASAAVKNAAVLTASGAQGGVIRAHADVDLKAAHLENAGAIAGRRDLLIHAQTVVNALPETARAAVIERRLATLSAGRHLQILDAVEVRSLGDLGAGLDPEGLPRQAGNLKVMASGQLIASGQNLAGGEVTLEGATVRMGGARTEAGGNLTVTATRKPQGDPLPEGAGLDLADAQTQAGGSITLTVETGSLQHERSKLTAGGAFSATALAGAFANDGGTITASQVTVKSAGLLNREGRITQAGAAPTHLESHGLLDNKDGEIKTSAREALISASGDVINRGGTLLAGGELTLEGAGVGNEQGRIEALGGRLKVTGSGPLRNLANPEAADPAGVIRGAGDTVLEVDSLTSSGTLASGGHLTIGAQGLLDNSGSVDAQGAATLATQGPLRNTGAILAKGDLTLTGAEVHTSNKLGAGIDDAGKAVLAGRLRIEAEGAVMATGQNSAGGSLAFTGASLSMPGARTAAGGDIALTAKAGPLDHQHANLHTGAAFTAKAPAGALVNDHGQIEAGRVEITETASISNRHGAITQTGQGKTRIESAGPLDNTAGTLKTAATDLDIRGSELRNGEKGEIQHGGSGLLDLRTGDFDNGGGTVASGGRAEVNAASLINRSGILSAQGTATIKAVQAIDNVQGMVQAGGALALEGQGIANQSGRILSTDGDLAVTAKGPLVNLAGTTVAGTPGGVIGGKAQTTLTVDSLTNTGAILGGTGLTLAAKDRLENTGILDTQGSATLTTEGTFRHTGTALAQGDLVVTAGEVDSEGRLGAGMVGQDQATGSGSLTVTAAGKVRAVGVHRAGGDLTFTGTELLLGSADPALPKADTLAGGKATLTATTGGIHHQGASLQAKGATTASAAQDVDNTRGLVQAGGDVALTGRQVTNGGGRVLAPGGSLAIRASGDLENAAGTVKAQRLDLNTGSLVNVDGQVVQLGEGPTTLAVAGAMDNTRGLIQTPSSGLAMAPRTLDNTDGTIAHAGTGQLALRIGDAHGALTNPGGRIQTNGGMTLDAGSIVTPGGILSARDRAIITVTDGAVDNTAKGDKGGFIGARVLAVTAEQGALSNGGGRIEGRDGVTLALQSLDNAGGHVVNIGEGTLAVTTAQGLENPQGTLGSLGEVRVEAARINNTSSGTMQGGPLVQIHARGDLDNTDGLLQASGSLKATAQGDLTNRGARIEAGGPGGAATTLTVSGNNVNNRGGRIHNAGTADTRVTANRQLDNTPAGTPDQGVIGGGGAVVVEAAQLLNREGGQVGAGQDLTLIVAERVDNTASRLHAMGHLTLQSPGANVINTRGQIASGLDLSLAARTVDRGGTLHGGRHAAISLQGDVTIPAGPPLLTANGNLTWRTTGALVNQGVLAAPGDLAVASASLRNEPAGVISGQKATRIEVAGVFSNAGRVYGEDIALRAGHFINESGPGGGSSAGISGSIDSSASAAAAAAARPNTHRHLGFRGRGAHLFLPRTASGLVSGATPSTGPASAVGSGVVAARNTLNIGASVTNRLGATIQAEGDLNIGRSLDEQHRATGRADHINNIGAEIRSGGGDMHLEATTISNENPRFTVAEVLLPKTEHVEFNPSDKYWHMMPSRDKRYDLSELTPTTGLDGIDQCYRVYTGRMVPEEPPAQRIGFFGRFNLSQQPPSRRMVPESWQFDDWKRFGFTRTTTRTTVKTTQPGEILAGRRMTLDAATILNDKSRIIAGGELAVPGGEITNRAHPGRIVTKDRGEYVDSKTEISYGKRHREYWGHPYDPPEAITPVDVEMGVALQRTPLPPKLPQTLSTSFAPGTGPEVAAPALAPNAANGLPVAPTGSAQSAGMIHPQALGTAESPIPDLSMLGSRLYQLNLGKDGACLYETDPLFLNKAPFPGLGQMMAELAIAPGNGRQRLGDGYIEAQLVARQVRDLTGRMFLSADATNANEDFTTLMKNGLAAAKSLNLEPGVMLTETQQKALTLDCLWIVRQQVTLADGRTEEAMVPVVFLSQARAADLKSTGALIAAKAITGSLTGSLENSGTIMAETRMRFSADTIANTGDLRTTGADSKMTLAARKDLVSEGTIQGHRVRLQAEDHIALRTTTVTTEASSGTRTAVAQVSRVNADTLFIEAGKNLDLVATQLQTSGDATLKAGGDLTLGTVATEYHERLGSGANHYFLDRTGTASTQVNTDGNLAFGSGATFHGTAASVRAGQGLFINADGDVIMDTAADTLCIDQAHHSVSHGTLSSSSLTWQVQHESSTAKGGTYTGKTVEVQAGQDVKVTGSAVVAEDDLSVKADRNLSLMAGTHSETNSGFREERESGLMASGGIGVSVGEHQQKHQFDQQSTLQSDARSQIASLKGKAALLAKGDLTASAADIAAKDKVDLAGRNVTLEAGRDAFHHHETHETRTTGLTLAVGSDAVDLAQSVVGHAEAALDHPGDDRVRGLNALLAAARARELAIKARKAQTALGNGSQDPVSAAGLRVSASVGSSRSRSEHTADSAAHSGTRVSSESAVTVTTTEDMKAKGSRVAGQNVNLNIGRNLDLRAAQDTRSTRSSQSGSSASLGVSCGLGKNGAGWSLDLAMDRSHGRGNGDSTTQVDTVVEAEERLTFQVGAHANLTGAQVRAGGITGKADSLTMTSLPDQDTYEYKEESAGISASIPLGPGRGSVGGHQGGSRTMGDFSSVQEATGLYAGAQGSQIEVKHQTRLDGAVSVSTAPERSTFVTGTLVRSAIENHALGSSSASGFAVSSAMGASPYQAVKGMAGTLAQQAGEDGADASTTHSLIQGAITVTDEAGQKALTGQDATQAIAGVRHEAESAHRALAPQDVAGMATRTKDKVQFKKLVFEAASACAEVGMDLTKALDPTPTPAVASAVEPSSALPTATAIAPPEALEQRPDVEKTGALEAPPVDPEPASVIQNGGNLGLAPPNIIGGLTVTPIDTMPLGPDGASAAASASAAVAGDYGELDFHITERAFGPADDASSISRPDTPSAYDIRPVEEVRVADAGGFPGSTFGTVPAWVAKAVQEWVTDPIERGTNWMRGFGPVEDRYLAGALERIATQDPARAQKLVDKLNRERLIDGLPLFTCVPLGASAAAKPSFRIKIQGGPPSAPAVTTSGVRILTEGNTINIPIPHGVSLAGVGGGQKPEEKKTHPDSEPSSSNSDLGAGGRPQYEPAPYHGVADNPVKSRAPINGQTALDSSVQVKPTSARRVGIDPKTGDFVVFDRTLNDTFHGHVRSWDTLNNDMKNILIKNKLVDKNGKIL